MGKEDLGFEGDFIQEEKAQAHMLLDGAEGMRRKRVLQLVSDAGAWKIDQVQSRDGGD